MESKTEKIKQLFENTIIFIHLLNHLKYSKKGLLIQKEFIKLRKVYHDVAIYEKLDKVNKLEALTSHFISLLCSVDDIDKNNLNALLDQFIVIERLYIKLTVDQYLKKNINVN